jgi:hypothetical protein
MVKINTFLGRVVDEPINCHRALAGTSTGGSDIRTNQNELGTNLKKALANKFKVPF